MSTSNAGPASAGGLTHARARLWIGIAAVGATVVVATVLLVLGAPARLPAELGGSLLSDWSALALLLGLAAVATLGFDVLGGFLAPRRFGRPHPAPAAFAFGWLRGVVALVVTASGCGALLLAAGRAGGTAAAAATLVVLSFALVQLQEPLARLVGGLRREEGGGADAPLVLVGADEGFTGGFTGLRGRPVLPAHWAEALGADALALLVERRRALARDGSRALGIAVAIGWNLVGFLLATALPGAGVRSLTELVTTALGFTLWTFVGLLLLPALSRRATAAADARVATTEPRRRRLAEAITRLDRLQDDEPERSAGVESVFHPVPAVAGRLRALEQGGPSGRAPWHVARTALVLSHVGLSLLPRAVHCNAGRPELWVYLPADG